jgi:hypothetical protein
MGRQLKAADILGEIVSDAPRAPTPAAQAPRREIPPPAPKADDRRRAAEIAAAGKPSPWLSDLRMKLRDQAQFNFGRIPRFIADGFEAKAREAGMNKREFLYHLLRKEGVDIPPYDEMDGRKL